RRDRAEARLHRARARVRGADQRRAEEEARVALLERLRQRGGVVLAAVRLIAGGHHAGHAVAGVVRGIAGDLDRAGIDRRVAVVAVAVRRGPAVVILIVVGLRRVGIAARDRIAAAAAHARTARAGPARAAGAPAAARR